MEAHSADSITRSEQDSDHLERSPMGLEACLEFLTTKYVAYHDGLDVETQLRLEDPQLFSKWMKRQLEELNTDGLLGPGPKRSKREKI